MAQRLQFWLSVVLSATGIIYVLFTDDVKLGLLYLIYGAVIAPEDRR